MPTTRQNLLSRCLCVTELRQTEIFLKDFLRNLEVVYFRFNEIPGSKRGKRDRFHLEFRLNSSLIFAQSLG